MRQFSRHSDRPRLASGLTLAQWDELYGAAAMARTFKKIRIVAIYAGLFLVCLIALFVYLFEPGHKAGFGLRTLSVAVQATFCVFIAASAMLVAEWLFDRYGSVATYKSSEGKKRGKYRSRQV